MNVIKIALSLLFIGLLVYVYVNYLPVWVRKFQEMVLEEPVKKEEVVREKKSPPVEKRESEKDEVQEKRVQEELRRVLGIPEKEEEKEEESIIDKIINYIKMLKEKFF